MEDSMSEPLTIQAVLTEVLKKSAHACVTIEIWAGKNAPENRVGLWDGTHQHYGDNLQAAFASYLAPRTDGEPAMHTAEQALEIIRQ